MPTYQYACTSCGHRFEAVQAFTDDSLTDCPVCAGQLRKVYGSVGVVFKGSGFYRTDSRNGKTASTAAAADGKSESKSDKPAAKSDSSSSGSGGSGEGKSTSSSTGSGSSTTAKAAS
ncbi:FmdB family zinc ribbon protein [Nakamurella sp.]|uniref:FmdB family zinc ribbon protein n=1 Tax=Nakamurella sp. TaxID=1869182 RepID=UPI003784B8A3